MIIEKDLGGVDKTFDYIFEELLPLDILKEIVYDVVRVHPEPSRDSTKSELIKSFVEYTKDRYPKKDHRRIMIDFLWHVDENKRKSSLKEPRYESDLNPVAKSMLKSKGYSVYLRDDGNPKEIEIGYTVADLIGYKKKSKPKIEEEPRFLDTIRGPEIIKSKEYWYEFCGIELKTAKRDKDPLFRQIEDYIQYFDYSFTTITPFSFLSNFSSGYLQERLHPKCESKGMGMLLMDENKVIGTILEAEEKHPLKKNREYLVEKMGLK